MASCRGNNLSCLGEIMHLGTDTEVDCSNESESSCDDSVANVIVGQTHVISRHHQNIIMLHATLLYVTM